MGFFFLLTLTCFQTYMKECIWHNVGNNLLQLYFLSMHFLVTNILPNVLFNVEYKNIRKILYFGWTVYLTCMQNTENSFKDASLGKI